jgi:hypothetical protein
MGEGLLYVKPVPERAKNIQDVFCLTFGKPGRPWAYDPVKNFDALALDQAMHAEGPPQKR